VILKLFYTIATAKDAYWAVDLFILAALGFSGEY